MADKFIQVPTNLDDSQVLKRFVTELVDKLNSNPIVSLPIMQGAYPELPGYNDGVGSAIADFLKAAARLDKLSGEVKAYITGNLQTEVLQNSEDLATITEQFGTFYDQATAAAWYGLTVKAGELISGFTVGGLDTDTTQPGTAGSFFAINADMFSVARAIEDIDDPAELAYLQANNLPYGTMYNHSTNEIIPAFLIEWNGTTYDILFNGKVTFSNIADAPAINQTFSQASAPTTGMIVGDTWIDTDDSNKVYTYTSGGWVVSAGNKTYAQTSAPTSGMVTNDIWYDTDDNNKPYYYNGSSWSAIRDGSIATAQARADSAYSYANSAYSEAVARVLPAGVADAINNNTTTINGSKITTGTINAAQLNANAIYGQTVYIDDTSNPAGTIFNGGTLGIFITTTQQNALAGVNAKLGGHGVTGINYNTTSGAGVYGEGDWGVAGKSLRATGEWGVMTEDKVYGLSGFFPFTGAHIAYSKYENIVGDIVDIVDSWVLDISQTAVWVEPSIHKYSKKVFGVISYQKDTMLDNISNNKLLTYKDSSGNICIKQEYADFISSMQSSGFKEVSINSLGEGGINVCSEGGDIEIGDYICSSSILGKGMKQDDDLLHNYTVAKALESVDWSKETQTTKMIACTYHCG